MAFPPAEHRKRRQETADRAERKKEQVLLGKRGYLWATLFLFVFSLVGHWAFAWPAYVQEQNEIGQPVEFQGYFIQTSRDTLENWQSEFLQLCWQVAGLALLWYVGSPQSRSGDEHKQEMLEHILRKVDPDDGDAIVKELRDKYPSK